ncbi:proline dehydrogenase 2, mitochondrial-like [Papaver somniferum]|uniref:proline dehydrogenase 2, mitochondrial-like n=1 Tax=Papaver somniferum TaxID=3469 RepID=UPI000E7001C2|nr:proline dehydrogenase 2, mitochondrial-like [Papaver somniferum]
MAVRITQKLLPRFKKSLNTSATPISLEPSLNLSIEKPLDKSKLTEEFLKKFKTSFNINSISARGAFIIGKTSPTLSTNQGIGNYKADTSDEKTLDFDDGKRLFKSVTTGKLIRSILNQQMASYDPIVNIGIWVMRSRLFHISFIRYIILFVVKHTFYDHFCAGENLDEARTTLQKLWNGGLKGIMDYGLEDATDNTSCDRNFNEFLKIVDTTKLLPPSSVSYACVKITAICPNSLLKKVSDLLRWEHKDPSFHLPWKVDTLPMLADSSPFYHTLNKPNHLTPTEEHDLDRAHQRLLKLSEKCLEMNLPLLVDAEYSSVQPAIDYLTYSTMIRINRDGNRIVHGTIQAYFKDAKERLIQATETAEKMGVILGLKLVRGAYLSHESTLASSLGFSSPIHESIQDTHACYDECASIMLEKVYKGTGAVVLATHNIESGKAAAWKAEEIGLEKNDEKVQFAQLKGMADGLSFALNNAGFLVSKYLPYGPVEMVIPYLLRRAEENKGLLATSTVDRQLMWDEIKRRLKRNIMKRV